MPKTRDSNKTMAPLLHYLRQPFFFFSFFLSHPILSLFKFLFSLFSAAWRTKWSDCGSGCCSARCAWTSIMIHASFLATIPCAATASSASSFPPARGACSAAHSVAEMYVSPGEGSQSSLSTFLCAAFKMNWGMKPKLGHVRFVTAAALHPSSAALTATWTFATSVFMNTALYSTRTQIM